MPFCFSFGKTRISHNKKYIVLLTIHGTLPSSKKSTKLLKNNKRVMFWQTLFHFPISRESECTSKVRLFHFFLLLPWKNWNIYKQLTNSFWEKIVIERWTNGLASQMVKRYFIGPPAKSEYKYKENTIA